MMITLVLIYLILLCLYYYVKLKDSTILIVKNYGQVIVQIVSIFVFLIFFIFFLRILRLFQYHQSLDLTLLNFNHNLILWFIFAITFRKLVIYFFKITWFKFHYVMICELNFSFHDKYKFFFYNIVYIPAFYSYKYLIWVNYVLTIGLVLSLGYDLLFNKLVLDFFLYYLKYYSLFKLVYVSYKFMATRQNLILDYYSYSLLYPGVVEESFFLNFDDLEHKNLMQESKKYTSGVILEKSVYIPKYLGNTAEMPYFKYLRQKSSK